MTATGSDTQHAPDSRVTPKSADELTTDGQRDDIMTSLQFPEQPQGSLSLTFRGHLSKPCGGFWGRGLQQELPGRSVR